jgi:arylsulfatase A-like enzyme
MMKSASSAARPKSLPAFLDMTDYEVGRVIKAIEETGQLDNTMVIFVYGDNGTSAEGGRNGMFSEMTYFNGVQETVPDMLKFIDKWGGPETYPHMAAGWAVALDTPYQWTKQVASDHGGTKVGMAIRWPAGMKAKGELRDPVSPCHRRGSDHFGGRQSARTKDCQRCRAVSHGRREHGLQLR